MLGSIRSTPSCSKSIRLILDVVPYCDRVGFRGGIYPHVLAIFRLCAPVGCSAKGASAQIGSADKAYDTHARLVEQLLDKRQDCFPITVLRSMKKQPREYARDLYKARHLVENCLCTA